MHTGAEEIGWIHCYAPNQAWEWAGRPANNNREAHKGEAMWDSHSNACGFVDILCVTCIVSYVLYF